jgi:hypothetical protein
VYAKNEETKSSYAHYGSSNRRSAPWVLMMLLADLSSILIVLTPTGDRPQRPQKVRLQAGELGHQGASAAECGCPRPEKPD